MTSSRLPIADRGFILLEVMIALAIMAGVVVTVIGAVNHHLGLAARDREETTAVLLARGKLAEPGFAGQETSDGSFAPVWPDYKWRREILPTELPGLSRLNSIGLSVTGRNLYTWTDYRGFDPEVGKTGGETGSSAIARVEGYQYPNFRTFTAAIDLVF